MACVLVFALAGGGVGTDARLGDSEVANVPVVVFGAADDASAERQSGSTGTPLSLTFEGLTSETADWPDGVGAVADDAPTRSTETTDETNESSESTTPQYVVRLDRTDADVVRFTLAGGEQTAATVAVDGALVADALGLSAFDPAAVELRVDGVVTGYDTTADGAIQFRTPDWVDRTVTFRVADAGGSSGSGGSDGDSATRSGGDSSDETPTTSEETVTPDDSNVTTEASPTPEPSTEESSTETPTETTPTETPTEESSTEETSTETPTEESSTETSSDGTETTESAPSETETKTESAPSEPETEKTTESESTPSEPETTPDEAGE
jgi:hypothetical protein